ncbi:MAG TPA: flagellar basal body rod C-terminal domain-containing protein [Microthrixaceae bacterium]|nr:flagellar basal body rod C-terminal domain-containing protein [Microthrixaceae bacterium]
MSGPFSSLGAPASGMRVYQTWINAVSDNIANISTVNPADQGAFQERFVLAQASGGGPGAAGGNQIGDGSFVSGAAFGSAEGRLVYNPEHPYADAEGMVRMPDIDMSTQMTNLIIAQRAYSANVTVFERARDSYLRALEIGK